MTRIFKTVIVSILILFLLVYFYILFPFWGVPFNHQRHLQPPLTPAWALESWLWEDDHNNAARVDELLTGYARYDIPVRTILLDSPWSLRYNDFIVDTTRYPNPRNWFLGLQEQGYRVVLWMTCMVNSHSRDTFYRNSTDWYDEARHNGFLAGQGHEVKWWKGKGGFIDYTCPQAMLWWHGLQKAVFDLGLDGWKLDDPATFFSSSFAGVPLPYQMTFGGLKTTRNYMNYYYRDEYQHGLKQNPEFITLVRSMDRPWTHPEGFAPLDAAPVCWVGDQQHIWSSTIETLVDSSQKDLILKGDRGLEEAVGDILQSARSGYCVVGSDIAGFSGRVIPADLYIRWTQFSAFCGLFMNGGHGERALWKRSKQELEIIRKFTWLHQELIPYMFSHVRQCHDGGLPLQRPMADNLQYFFGSDFIVAPMVRPSLKQKVTLPQGGWRYFFQDTVYYQGPMTFTLECPMDEYPVFVRDGAIIPMNISRPYTGFGDSKNSCYTTWLIYPQPYEREVDKHRGRSWFDFLQTNSSKSSKRNDGENQFALYYPDHKAATTVHVQTLNGEIEIRFSGKKQPHILRILLLHKPIRIELDDFRLTEGQQWHYDAPQQRVIVKTDYYDVGRYCVFY